MALTDIVVRQAKATGKHYTLGDFDGLCLFVSARGYKTWHFRYGWLGNQKRLSLGPYPQIGLRDARTLRDEARALLAREVNPKQHRDHQRQADQCATEYTFEAVFEKWLQHRRLSLKEGRQRTASLIPRIFANDILPALHKRTIYGITRADLLEVVGRIERRKAFSVAEKVRTWLNQLFRYALVIVPGLERNPASDLDVVAVPQPPVRHNPFLRMQQLPAMLQDLRRYPGKLQVQLGIRLLLLTGVRTGELRRATPDQFRLDEGLWLIPPEAVKQLQMKMLREHRRPADIPPYIVPLSTQAIEIIRYLLDERRPAQRYLLPHAYNLKECISENTINAGLKRMGYEGLLTGHGIRGTLSTALNELGYPKAWVEAQLSHADRDKVSAAYNHAQYVEQRRRMMQDWSDRLDLFEQNQIQLASTPLTIHVEGIPTVVREAESVSSPPLSAVQVPSFVDQQAPSPDQRERIRLLEILEAPHNLPVAQYAKLSGKSRRWISYEIQAGNLLAISLGNRGQRVPDWQLNLTRRKLVQAVLREAKGVDPWQIYHALLRPQEALNGLTPIAAVTPENGPLVVQVTCANLSPDSC
ncbi:MAG: tyrosine-type recombinase/integrase [Pseudomonas sp.]